MYFSARFLFFPSVLGALIAFGNMRPCSALEDAATPVVSQQVFDSSVTELPKNFVGNDMGLLSTALKDKSIADKDEFETSEAFTTRLNLAVAEKMGLKGKWNDNSTFATLWAPSDSMSAMRYNADSEVMRVSYPFRTFGGNLAISPFYTFDKSAVILVFRDGSTIPSFEMKMKRDEAKEVKPNLRILMIFRLAGKEGFFPVWQGDDFVISTEPSEMWLFNSETGKIYSKSLFPKPEVKQ